MKRTCFWTDGLLIPIALLVLVAGCATPAQRARFSAKEKTQMESKMSDIAHDPAFKTDTPPENDNRETCLRRFEKGETLIDLDDRGLEHFFVLKNGSLEAHFRDGRVTELKNPDTYFCALFSFLDDPSFVRITAAEPSAVYLFPADMKKLSEISPAVANTLVRKLLLLVKKREKQLETLKKEYESPETED